MNSDHRYSEKPGDGPQRFVESRGQQAAVGQSRRSLMVLGDQQLCVNGAAFAGGQRQVQSGQVVRAAAEALPIVTAKRSAGGRRVRVPYRRDGV